MIAVIEATGLSAGYGSGPVVRNLDIRVDSGQVVALLGPNGAGKTTTLMTLAGELPAQAGTVELYGKPAPRNSYRRVKAGVSVVTEERSVFMEMTVEENLRVARCDVGTVTELFPELSRLLARRAGLLSGGEQQMLTLGRALARKPRVLLVDELSLGLAPLIVARLLAAVRTAADDLGVGVLLVEQHIDKAIRVADYVHVMQRGEIVFSDTAKDAIGKVSEIEASYFSS